MLMDMCACVFFLLTCPPSYVYGVGPHQTGLFKRVNNRVVFSFPSLTRFSSNFLQKYGGFRASCVIELDNEVEVI